VTVATGLEQFKFLAVEPFRPVRRCRLDLEPMYIKIST